MEILQVLLPYLFLSAIEYISNNFTLLQNDNDVSTE